MAFIKGFIERIDHDLVTGWACDLTAPQENLRVQLRVGDQIVAETFADITRDDLAKSRIGNGRHGFEINIPPQFRKSLISVAIEAWVAPVGSNEWTRLKTLGASDHRSSLGRRILNKLSGIRSHVSIDNKSANSVSDVILENPKGTSLSLVSSNYADGAENVSGHSFRQDDGDESLEVPKDAPKADIISKFEVKGKLFGFIDRATSNLFDGWMLASNPNTTPLLLVDGIPAARNEWPIPRSDVSAAFGVERRAGFSFGFNAPLGTEANLLAFDGSKLLDLVNTTIQTDGQSGGLGRIHEILKDCSKPDAVAITCWDGAHNPVGRAKVLYDVLDGRRPVWLFCYLFDEFGGKIWEPLANTNIRIVAIPWKDRERYHRMFQIYGVKFPTVWMCKPRLPTLMLASAIAAENARLVLDFDDNEEHFSLSKGSIGKPYGGETIGLVRSLIEDIKARTAASRSLAEDFSAEIVRHARRPALNVYRKKRSSDNRPIRIGFVGTVRAHKNILNAAQSIQVLNHICDRSLEFHVYGDIRPDDYRKQLEANRAFTYGTVHAENLESILQTFDVVLTGYPSSKSDDEPITRYQITSKIGDALANGIPALVPYSRSVADLENVPGIFLFTIDNFHEKIEEALSYSKRITLPFEFNPDGAYLGFQKAEATAPENCSCLGSIAPPPLRTAGQSVLLIWKQQDGALYGRRVDQIARAIKLTRPDVMVRVVEFMNDSVKSDYCERRSNFMSDASKLLSLSDQKCEGGFATADGVIYNQLRVKSDADAAAALVDFLWTNGNTPHNTVMVTFPAFSLLTQLAPVLRMFPLTADIVDNQLTWGNNKTRPDIIAQYVWLMRSARNVVFNSQTNMEFFKSAGFLRETPENRTLVIPNWYMPINGQDIHRKSQPLTQDGKVKIIYSGNLNDRIDWDLLEATANVSEQIQLHVVGDGSRASERLRKLISLRNTVYHGPLSETQVSTLLGRMHFAIMPHTRDEVSNFMNPLKVLMYSAHGLCTVATAVPGLNSIDGLVSFDDPANFINAVRQLADQSLQGTLRIPTPGPRIPQFAHLYTELIEAELSSLLA